MKLLSELTDDDYEAARRVIEDLLIESRDGRMSVLNRGNGLVVRERDGAPSSVMRCTIVEALRLAVRTWIALDGTSGVP